PPIATTNRILPASAPRNASHHNGLIAQEPLDTLGVQGRMPLVGVSKGPRPALWACAATHLLASTHTVASSASWPGATNSTIITRRSSPHGTGRFFTALRLRS